ncbi:MAG TPA: N-acetyltransferase [Aggregatilineales bacterium]|nr:N-acetyltransferase [Aggregatilineales bacterium]
MIKPYAYMGVDDLEKLMNFNAQVYGIGGALGYLHVGDIPHRIYNNLRNFNPADVVHLWKDENDTLLAWTIIYPMYPAFDLQIAPQVHGSDIEETILRWLIQETHQQAQKQATLFGNAILTEVSEHDPIRADLLRKYGFIAPSSPTYIHAHRPLNQPIPHSPLPEGYIIRPATGIEDAPQLAQVHAGAFGSRWTTEQYQRFMESPGYSADHEMVVVAPTGQFVSFCVYWLDKINGVGLFEPMGTHKDFHRMGFARALMNETLRYMIRDGMQVAEITYETDNPPAEALYRSIGFEPMYATSSYQKALDSIVV